MNLILGGMIDPIQDDIRRRFSWVLGLLDKLWSRTDEIITQTGIIVARKQAWRMALALADSPGAAAFNTLVKHLDIAAATPAELAAHRGSAIVGLIQRVRRWDRMLASHWP